MYMTLLKPQKEVPCMVEITTLSAYCCIFFQPSGRIDHHKALATSNGYCVVTATNTQVNKMER